MLDGKERGSKTPPPPPLICSGTGSAAGRSPGGSVGVFLTLWKRVFELPQKEEEKKESAVAKISSTCLRWKLVDLKRRRGPARAETRLSPSEKKKKESTGSHQEARRCPHVNKARSDWLLAATLDPDAVHRPHRGGRIRKLLLTLAAGSGAMESGLAADWLRPARTQRQDKPGQLALKSVPGGQK